MASKEEHPPMLPSLASDPDISLDFIIQNSGNEEVKQRVDHVQKLAEENAKLEAELKAMEDRLKAAERRSMALTSRPPNIPVDDDDQDEQPAKEGA